MPHQITMPKTGHIEDEATVYEWHKRVGDRVEVGDVVLTVETQKAVLEVESFVSGVLVSILIPEGETVAVGTVLALVEDA